MTTERRGDAPDLVMVPGWGMHADVWSEWADLLARDFRVHRVELPGHGAQRAAPAAHLDAWSDAVLAQAPPRACWLGWSLGGLVALNAARRQPQRFGGLVLVAATPRFVTAPDWPHAVAPAVFDQFAAQLAHNCRQTLLRFLALQVRGIEHEGAALRRLRGLVGARPDPQPQALADGLRLLQHSDLRAAVATLAVPLYWLFGGRDTLVPPQVSARVPGVRQTLPEAGHAPFLSHPQACAERVRQWLQAEGDTHRYVSG